jgi:hypothetical protein
VVVAFWHLPAQPYSVRLGLQIYHALDRGRIIRVPIPLCAVVHDVEPVVAWNLMKCGNGWVSRARNGSTGGIRSTQQ